MSAEISAAYEPKSVEEKWYRIWLEQKCFQANTESDKPPYAIVIPPPNVTGVLTMGHVLNNYDPGYPGKAGTSDGERGALAAWHGSCRHRDAKCC